MKLVATVYNLKQLNKFIKYIDCAILNISNYSLVYENLDLDKSILLCNSNNVLPIIALNRIMHPGEIDLFKDVLLKYKNKNVLFLVTDIGVCNIAIKENMQNQIIFDPQTMITNYKDLSIYSSFNFNSLAMSLEIPINDVLNSLNEVNCSLFYQIFGHRIMFYSKRRLISLYEEKCNIVTSHNKLYLRESTRNDLLPVIENDNGTIIYRSYLISLLKHYDILDKLMYGYLESLYIDDDIFIEILKIYYQVFKNNLSVDIAISKINNLSLDIKDGFTYKDSVYQKEEF